MSKTVLAVDDDLDTLNIISLKLEAHGIKVIKARDGYQGFTLFQKHRPDLAILDVMMPKMNGFKVVWLIKHNDASRSTPVILLTARTQESDKKTSEEVKADLYLTKPFDPEELLRQVQRLLGMGDG